MERPQPTEYAEYYSLYIDQVPDQDIFQVLDQGLRSMMQLSSEIKPEWSHYSYAPGKWTLNEVIGHMVDAERTFGFRAFWFARSPASELPSMEQDDFVRESRAQTRSIGSLLEEFEHLRRSHILLFRSFDEEILARRGTAFGCEFTIRSHPYIMAGHEIHHRKVIAERYLAPLKEAASPKISSSSEVRA